MALMKQVMIMLVVALVAILAVRIVEHMPSRDPVSAPAVVTPPPGLKLRYTEALVEDGWVNGARMPGADLKPLENSANSICFLTKIEIKGVQGPGDDNSCSIDIDEFTGFWQVTAAVEEGGKSEVRCNARCLIWE